MTFASSDLPNLHSHQRPLRFAFHCWWPYRVATFPSKRICWVRCPLSTGRLDGHECSEMTNHPCLQHFLVKACQPFTLFDNYDLYRGFKYFHHTSCLELTQLTVSRKTLLSRFTSRAWLSALCCIVKIALYSDP